MNDFVSVIIPILNEEKHIENCIKSLLTQDYPIDCMEWIFVDGGSTDSTLKIIDRYFSSYPKLIKILNNPKKIVPCAMNIGIIASKGKYVVRLDAHAEYASDYISKCVECLNTVDADNVGGIAETKSDGFVGNAIAKMLSSKFGVGNSQFRTNGKSGYVDTVPFGAFRREVFSNYGGFDERLVRNEDNEINYRIRKNGGKVYLSDDIHLTYYCRDTLKGISKMAKSNGMWSLIAMKLCPGSMRIRHFIPFVFVLSIILLTLAGVTFTVLGAFYNSFKLVYQLVWGGLCAELLLYLALDIIFSCCSGDTSKERLLLILLFPIFHVSYGFGSITGIFKVMGKKYNSKNYNVAKI
ncbi:MAG: glycosyltransferase family 2 protein [Roseburia sp.]|nr:glycosyltransferase family 2 protein [Roseburia sp.]